MDDIAETKIKKTEMPATLKEGSLGVIARGSFHNKEHKEQFLGLEKAWSKQNPTNVKPVSLVDNLFGDFAGDLCNNYESKMVEELI